MKILLLFFLTLPIQSIAVEQNFGVFFGRPTSLSGEYGLFIKPFTNDIWFSPAMGFRFAGQLGLGGIKGIVGLGSQTGAGWREQMSFHWSLNLIYLRTSNMPIALHEGVQIPTYENYVGYEFRFGGVLMIKFGVIANVDDNKDAYGTFEFGIGF